MKKIINKPPKEEGDKSSLPELGKEIWYKQPKKVLKPLLAGRVLVSAKKYL